MASTDRNAMCPCGSGKEHRHCCLGKILLFPNRMPQGFEAQQQKLPAPATDLEELMGEEFSFIEDDEALDSFVDQMNSKAIDEVRSRNNEPEPDFLGLSPAQVRDILRSPFSTQSELLTIEPDDPDQIRELPMMRQAYYLIERLGVAGGVKATAKGNLSRALVRELYHEFFEDKVFPYPPNKEQDCLGVVHLRSIMTEAGLVQMQGQRFCLTEKGEVFGAEGHEAALFDLLFTVSTKYWNWAYGDRYPDLDLIQESAIFNFYLLSEVAQTWVMGYEFAGYFVRAFPMVLEEFRWGDEALGLAKRCYELRFLERFCLPWGLVLRDFDDDSDLDHPHSYKVSPFFKSAFKFE